MLPQLDDVSITAGVRRALERRRTEGMAERLLAVAHRDDPRALAPRQVRDAPSDDLGLALQDLVGAEHVPDPHGARHVRARAVGARRREPSHGRILDVLQVGDAGRGIAQVADKDAAARRVDEPVAAPIELGRLPTRRGRRGRPQRALLGGHGSGVGSRTHQTQARRLQHPQSESARARRRLGLTRVDGPGRGRASAASQPRFRPRQRGRSARWAEEAARESHRDGAVGKCTRGVHRQRDEPVEAEPDGSPRPARASWIGSGIDWPPPKHASDVLRRTHADALVAPMPTPAEPIAEAYCVVS